MFQKHRILTFWGMGHFFFLISNLWASTSITELGVPCRQSDADPAFLRSCQDVIQGKKGGATYTEQIPGMLDQLDDQLNVDVEQAYGYKRCDKDKKTFDCKIEPGFYDYSADPDHPEKAKIYHFEKTTCSLFPNFFNGNVAEETKNHHGESCGEPSCVYVHVKPIEVFGICVGVDVTRSLHLGSTQPVKDKKYCDAKDKGQLERAYFAGSLIQSYDFYRLQVRDEISKQKKLMIHKGCSAAAQAVENLNKESTQQSLKMSQNLKKDVKDRANISDIFNCEKRFDLALPTQSVGVDVGSLRQSAQHLCAARKDLESAFTQLARCEVANRAMNSFVKNFGTVDQFAHELRAEEGVSTAGDQCSDVCDGISADDDNPRNRCQTKMKECLSRYSGPVSFVVQTPTQICNDEVERKCRSCDGATACATKNANACYLRELPKFTKEKARIWKTE